MRRGPSLRQLELEVENFNLKYPVGTKVLLRKDSGEIETVVREKAYVFGGHSAVAFFEGVSGAYSIEGRVNPVEPKGGAA